MAFILGIELIEWLLKGITMRFSNLYEIYTILYKISSPKSFIKVRNS